MAILLSCHNKAATLFTVQCIYVSKKLNKKAGCTTCLFIVYSNTNSAKFSTISVRDSEFYGIYFKKLNVARVMLRHEASVNCFKSKPHS